MKGSRANIEKENVGGFSNYSPPKNILPKEPIVDKHITIVGKTPIPFFVFSNEFLETLIICSENSPTRSAIVEQKTQIALGDGYVLYNGKRSRLIQQSKSLTEGETLDKFNDFFCDENAKNKTIDQLIECSLINYFTCANDYLLLKRWEFKGEKKFEVQQLEPLKCLLFKDEKGKLCLGFNESFEPYFSSDDTKFYPIFPNWSKSKGVEYSVIHTKQKRAGREYYGVPSSASSLKYQLIEAQKPRMVKEDMDADFHLATIVTIIDSGLHGKADEINELEQTLNDRITRKKSNAEKRKLVLNVVPDKQCFGVDVQQIKSNTNYDYFKASGDDAQTQIIISEGWSKLLMSLHASSKQGSTREIENELKRVMQSVINPARNKILSAYNRAWLAYCKWMGVEDNTYFEIRDNNQFLTIEDLEKIYANDDLKNHFNIG